MWADDVHWYPLFLSGTPFRVRPRARERGVNSAAPATAPGCSLRPVAPAPPQGTFWFRETTTLVAHQLEAVGEEAVAADDAEA